MKNTITDLEPTVIDTAIRQMNIVCEAYNNWKTFWTDVSKNTYEFTGIIGESFLVRGKNGMTIEPLFENRVIIILILLLKVQCSYLHFWQTLQLKFTIIRIRLLTF